MQNNDFSTAHPRHEVKRGHLMRTRDDGKVKCSTAMENCFPHHVRVCEMENDNMTRKGSTFIRRNVESNESFMQIAQRDDALQSVGVRN